MLGASLVAAFAVARLASGAYAATMVTAAIGALMVAVLQRHPAAAVTLGVLAVAASALWWGVHASDRSWVPTPHGLRAFSPSLQAARGILADFHRPLPHSAGILALSALVGGLAAVGGRGAGIRAPALSLVPAIILVVWSATLLPSTSAAVAGLVLGACGFLALWSSQPTRNGATLAVAGLSLALAAAALTWTSEAGSAVVARRSPAVPEVAPSAASLATDLTGVETRDAHLVLFRATTPVPTYWQVTSLTTFYAGQWLPDAATSALLGGAAPVQVTASPPGPATFASAITLSAYGGRLLPAPPSTVAASGSPSPVVTPSGVVATSSYASGSDYTTTAEAPSPVSDAPQAAASDSATNDFTATGPLPAGIQSLALSITGGQSTVLDRAEALVDYFRSGRFRYQVDATQPAGTDPLLSFLTITRTGSCEQFAGAFAMLARASGLPTRVAIGFTPGRMSSGVTVVRGSDAHAWPQVHIGGRWVSFEPTPSLPSGELPPPGVLGPAALGRPSPTTPDTQPSVSVPGATVPVTGPPLSPTSTGRSMPPAHGGILADVILAAGGMVVAITGTVALILRRRRKRPPDVRVAVAWRSISRALSRRRLARPDWRTPMGHVRDLAADHHDEQGRATVEDMASVARLLDQVAYGTAAVTPEQAERAERAGRRARRAVLAGSLSAGAPTGAGTTERPGIASPADVAL